MKSISEILQLLKSKYSALITESLKDLLESKHLYQSIKIDISSIVKGVEKLSLIYEANKMQVLSRWHKYISLPWETGISKPYRVTVEPQSEGNAVPVNLPTVKVYCDQCNRVEPYNPFSVEFSETQQWVTYPEQENRQVCQLFFLEYQCQSCKGTPEIFLVRKEGHRISLHGRSPMEVYPCPKVIPKNFRKYFSDSVVAFNSGQGLAALFLQRTFIEQFTRCETNATDTQLVADDILSAYMKKLPEDFKQRFPSLKSIYSDLSLAIHRAKPTDELFTKTRNEIVEHFEARKLFELT